MKTNYTHPDDDVRFLEELDRTIEFYRTKNDDAHGINTAVMIAVLEIRNAFAKTHNMPIA